MKCSYEFFARHPHAKLRYAKRTPLGRGYVPFEERSDSQKNSTSAPSTSIRLGFRSIASPSARGAWAPRSCATLARVEPSLLRLLAAALAKRSGTELAPDHLIRSRGRHRALLRINHYPATGRRHGPEILHNGPHIDWSSITILLQDRERLEVQDGKRWRSVPVDRRGLVANFGKQVHRISDGLFAASMHRVNTPDCTEARILNRLLRSGGDRSDRWREHDAHPSLRGFEPVEIRELIGRLAEVHRGRVV